MYTASGELRDNYIYVSTHTMPGCDINFSYHNYYAVILWP